MVRFAAEVAVDPLHGGLLVGHGALGDQVVDVVGPVLDGGVTHPRARLADDFHHRAVQRLAGVRRRRAAFHVVHLGALVDDDQGALELSHVLAVDAEIGLQRHVHGDAGRHVHEAAAAPHRGVERRKLVVLRRDDGAEVLAQQVGMLLQGLVGRQEDDALTLEVLLEGVVHHLGVVLGADAGQEFALRLGDAQAVERFLDVVRHVFPRPSLAVGGLDVVVDVVEVNVLDPAAPRRRRLLLEDFQGVEADVAHPAGLALDLRHLGDDFLVDALLARKTDWSGS